MSKYMNIDEFVTSGLLREVNRVFFHPLGLSLAVSVDEQGNRALHGIFDARDDPKGIIFDDPAEPNERHVIVEKALCVQCMRDERKHARMAAFGWIIQPLPVNDKDP